MSTKNAYIPTAITVLAVDFRAGINGRPDNVILVTKEHEQPLWVPVWDGAEFDAVDALLSRQIPEEGISLNLRHRVNDAGYDDYRLVVEAKAALKAARKRREAIEAANAVAAE